MPGDTDSLKEDDARWPHATASRQRHVQRVATLSYRRRSPCLCRARSASRRSLLVAPHTPAFTPRYRSFRGNATHYVHAAAGPGFYLAVSVASIILDEFRPEMSRDYDYAPLMFLILPH